MATVKIKLRPSRIPGRAGTLLYQVTHGCKTRQIATNMHLLPQQWNERNRCIVSSDDVLYRMQKRIDSAMLLFRAIINNLDVTGVPYTVDDVMCRFRNPDNRLSFLAFMKEQIDYLRSCNRFGTAANYERAMRSFSQFLEGDLPIVAIDEQLVESYNVYLSQRHIARNSVSFYMRIIRAVYNKAVRRHLTEQTAPFQNVYTGIDKTRKRAIDETTVAQLVGLDLSQVPRLALTRDLFIFSYCARGMAFVDVAHLKKSDIRDGMLLYARHKTGQMLTVKIEPNMREIMDCYAIATEGSPYVFPVLTSSDIREAYGQYRKAINVYNRQLKELSRLLSIECPVTSYTARHSWANAARKHHAPVAVISAALGHSSEKTTQIYLTSLENTVIDAVNKGIIANLYK